MGNHWMFNQIVNTLTLLMNQKLLYFYYDPIVERNRLATRISWPNHESGRHNCGDNYCKIIQWKRIVETNAFTCLIIDGSIIRAEYNFENNGLTSHSLLWWPSPFILGKDDYDIGGPLDIFDLYADSKSWFNDIQMRTPIRFDYDTDHEGFDHPKAHLHFQHPDTRFFVSSPICFNAFIKFVYKNCYPNTYNKHCFWGDLEEMNFDILEFPDSKSDTYFYLRGR